MHIQVTLYGYMKSHAIHTDNHFEGTVLRSTSCYVLASPSYAATLSYTWSSFYLFLFETLVQNPGASNPTHPAMLFGFMPHLLFHFPFFKLDAELRRWCFLTIRSVFYFDYLTNDLKSSSDLQCVALKQVATSFLSSWASVTQGIRKTWGSVCTLNNFWLQRGLGYVYTNLNFNSESVTSVHVTSRG